MDGPNHWTNTDTTHQMSTLFWLSVYTHTYSSIVIWCFMFLAHQIGHCNRQYNAGGRYWPNNTTTDMTSIYCCPLATTIKLRPGFISPTVTQPVAYCKGLVGPVSKHDRNDARFSVHTCVMFLGLLPWTELKMNESRRYNGYIWRVVMLLFQFRRQNHGGINNKAGAMKMSLPTFRLINTEIVQIVFFCLVSTSRLNFKSTNQWLQTMAFTTM